MAEKTVEEKLKALELENKALKQKEATQAKIEEAQKAEIEKLAKEASAANNSKGLVCSIDGQAFNILVPSLLTKKGRVILINVDDKKTRSVNTDALKAYLKDNPEGGLFVKKVQ